MAYFPMFISLENERALVVGGGRIARHKAEVLISFGCLVTVIAEQLRVDWSALEKRVTILTHALTAEELTRTAGEYAVVVSAVDAPEVSEWISTICKAARIPVNVVDDKEKCSFQFPALVRREDMIIGINGGGRAPFYTGHLRKELDRMLPEHIGLLLEVLSEQREQVRGADQEWKEEGRKPVALRNAEGMIAYLEKALERNPDIGKAQLRTLAQQYWRR